MSGNLRRVFGHTYVLAPTGVAATDTAAFNLLIDRIPAASQATVVIRDNGQPLRLGIPGVSPTPKSIIGKSIFFRGETVNSKIIWGCGSGTGVQGLYNLNFGGYTSPLSATDVMPANVTRATMSAMPARRSYGTSASLALAKGDRVMLWSDDHIAGGAHNAGGTQRPGELHRVEWTSGSDFCLDNWIVDELSTNPCVAKIVMLKGCGFADLQFGYEGPPRASRTTGYNYIDVRYCQDFIMENVRVDENGVGTLLVHACDRPRFVNYSADYMNYDGDYGVLDTANRDLLMVDCHWRFMRHLHTTGGIADAVHQWTLVITATSSTYTLNYGGQVTTAIAYNANAATVQAALSALSTVPTDELVVTGTPTRFTITTAGSLLASTLTLTLPGSTVSGSVSTLVFGGGTAVLTSSVARYGNSRGTQIVRCKTSLGGDNSTTIMYGFALHHEGYEVTYRDCTVEIGAQANSSLAATGFESRARNTRYYNCTVEGNNVTSYGASTLRNICHGWEPRRGGIELHGCRAENLWRGVAVLGDFQGVHSDNLLINDMIFDRCTGNGVDASVADSGYGEIDNITVRNSVFRNCGENVGASTQGADIRITQGTGHKLYFNELTRDVNRYAFSFEGLASTDLEIFGNICRNYSTFGVNKLGIRGQTGDPFAVVEATADGIQTAFGSQNYTSS